MAFNGAAASSDQARLVAEITGFGDHAVIIKALQGNHGDVDKVVNEFYEGGADKVGPSPSGSSRSPSFPVADAVVVQAHVRLVG
jgi:hypothetical protein